LWAIPHFSRDFPFPRILRNGEITPPFLLGEDSEMA